MREISSGVTLRRVLQSNALTPAQAVAVGNSVLAELEALHAAGVAHGGIHPETVWISNDGRASLEPAHAEGGAGYPELADDVRSCGLLICAAFGVDPMREQAPASTGMGPEAVAAVHVAREMVRGMKGKDTEGAWTDFVTAAGSLGSMESLSLSHAQLGDIAGSLKRSMPLLGALSEGWQNLTDRVSGGAIPTGGYNSEPQWWKKPRVIGSAAAVLILILVTLYVVKGGSGPSSLLAINGSSPLITGGSPSPTTSASFTSPSPAPTHGTGTVDSVIAQPSGSCSPGSSCSVDITVNFPALLQDQDVAWTLTLTDKCTNTTTDAPGGHVAASQGWTSIEGTSSVSLPNAKAVIIVAKTTTPEAHSSTPVTVGGGC
ncbi:MAG TPA: hypothetical protein VG015_06170 [Candidatus Dormibacteraeota bacterium]|jgi:hypothetical protein|nr:hypothetical protein [Candidatus Dormibacteraeota bacterium]